MGGTDSKPGQAVAPPPQQGAPPSKTAAPVAPNSAAAPAPAESKLPDFRRPETTPFWGFHWHAEVGAPNKTNCADTAAMLIVWQHARALLEKHNAPIVAAAAFNNVGGEYGYPAKQNTGNYAIHVSPSVEVRVELPPPPSLSAAAGDDIQKRAALCRKITNTIYPLFGRMILWTSCLTNSRGFGGYIHGIFHDESLSMKDCMKQEYDEHKNVLFFCGKETELDLSFFLAPPLDDDKKLVDTRNPNMLSDERIEELVKNHSRQPETAAPARDSNFVDDVGALAGDGVRFVVHFSRRSPTQKPLGEALFENLMVYLNEEGAAPDEADIERRPTNNAFDAAFFVFFKAPAADGADDKGVDVFLSKLGRVAAYLMLNRNGLDVSVLCDPQPAKGVERDGAMQKVLAAMKCRLVAENVEGYAFLGKRPPIGGRKVSWLCNEDVSVEQRVDPGAVDHKQLAKMNNNE